MYAVTLKKPYRTTEDSGNYNAKKRSQSKYELLRLPLRGETAKHVLLTALPDRHNANKKSDVAKESRTYCKYTPGTMICSQCFAIHLRD